jgi:hypothetical protein
VGHEFCEPILTILARLPNVHHPLSTFRHSRVSQATSPHLKYLERRLYAKKGGGGSGFGVEEFGEAGVFGYGVEVGVEAGLEAVLGVEADGFGQVLDALGVVAGHAGEQG